MNFSTDEKTILKQLVSSKYNTFLTKKSNLYTDLICRFGEDKEHIESRYNSVCETCNIYDELLKKIVNL